jgi:hypothetical protein
MGRRQQIREGGEFGRQGLGKETGFGDRGGRVKLGGGAESSVLRAFCAFEAGFISLVEDEGVL